MENFILMFEISITTFLFLLVLHIIIWRNFKIKGQVSTLFLIFGLMPVALCGLIFCASPLFTFPDMALSLFLLWSLGGAYIQTYPSIQHRSPSLVILDSLDNVEDGLTESELVLLMVQHGNSSTCYANLIDDHFAQIENNVCIVTPKGKKLAGFFTFYRSVLGLKPGEG